MGQLRVLSLFSGCGGLDLGFEGGFFQSMSCYALILLKKSYEIIEFVQKQQYHRKII